jgi:hypothetical protein
VEPAGEMRRFCVGTWNIYISNIYISLYININVYPYIYIRIYLYLHNPTGGWMLELLECAIWDLEMIWVNFGVILWWFWMIPDIFWNLLESFCALVGEFVRFFDICCDLWNFAIVKTFFKPINESHEGRTSQMFSETLGTLDVFVSHFFTSFHHAPGRNTIHRAGPRGLPSCRRHSPSTLLQHCPEAAVAWFATARSQNIWMLCCHQPASQDGAG